MQLDGPAFVVKFSKGFDRVDFRIEECGDDEAALGSEAVGGKMNFHNAEGEGFRDFGKFLFGDACGRFDGLGPGLEAVVGAKLFAFCHIAVTALVEADNAVDALLFELGEGVEGAKSPVCEEDVVFFQKAPQTPEEKGLVNVVVACGEFEQGAAGEREEADEMHEREAATGLLGGGLGIFLLVEGSVWHGDSCAVDDLDMAAFPEGALGCVAFAAVGDVFGDFGEGFFGKLGAGFAVGDGFMGGIGLGIGTSAPSLHATDDFSTRGIWGKNLRKKGPEEDVQAVLALTAKASSGGRGQKFVGNGVGADGLEVTQGVGGLEFFECFGLLGFGTAAEKQGAEGWKKRRGVSHKKQSV